MLWLLRWRIEGEIPDEPKLVIAVAPHTSNWDFVVGIAAMFTMDLRLSYLAKHTLFRPPFGGPMRWTGGIPVDRSSPHGVVGDAVAAFERSDKRLLAIAPQGTRTAGARYKSGFIHIARGARVPITFATLDYGVRCLRLGPTYVPSDDIDAELRRCEMFYVGAVSHQEVTQSGSGRGAK